MSKCQGKNVHLIVFLFHYFWWHQKGKIIYFLWICYVGHRKAHICFLRCQHALQNALQPETTQRLADLSEAVCHSCIGSPYCGKFYFCLLSFVLVHLMVVMVCYCFNVYRHSQRELVWARFFPAEITFSQAKSQRVSHSLQCLWFFFPVYYFCEIDVLPAFCQSFSLWPVQQCIICKL